jgi:uncharacterized membrane protein YqgA involved in biofilm formation
MERWRFEKRMNVSGVVQVLMLAGLIVGSWFNLQRQLDLLGRDVRQLLQTQEKLCDKADRLGDTVVAHEYQIREMEKGKR